jgi:hypothetical protein
MLDLQDIAVLHCFPASQPFQTTAALVGDSFAQAAFNRPER